MKTIDLKEVQRIETDMLCFIDRICSENDIKYYVAFGSLIGTIRHKGFIPWDDDIDILMPREDYNKLIEYLNHNPHGYYRIVSFDTDKNYTNALPKMIDTRTFLKQNYGFNEKVELGVYIDIFIIDGLGDSFDESVIRVKESNKIGEKWLRANTKFITGSKNVIKDFLRGVKNSIYKIKGTSFYLKELNIFATEKSFYNCKYVTTMCWPTINTPEKMTWDVNWFGNGIKAEFEGFLFTIPSDYDSFLKNYYGDYMILPPESERKTHHRYSAFWK